MRAGKTQKVFRAIVLVALLAVLAASGAGFANEKVVVTITGKTANGVPVGLTLSDVRALPASTFTTFDPWDRIKRTYVGPRILDVLSKAGWDPAARRIIVHASNDYEIPILIDDLERIGHILSYEMDGKPYAAYRPPANKGNLAVAIDFSSSGIDMEIYKHQLVWWVDAIVID